MESIEEGKGHIWGGFSVDSSYVTTGTGMCECLCGCVRVYVHQVK
jgi:hypothetical protein